MARRRGNAPPISLFSFQDIVTSVAGIIIFLTLMMAVELIRAKEEAPAVRTEAMNEQLETQIQQLQREIARLEGQRVAQQESLQTAATLTTGEIDARVKESRQQIEQRRAEVASLAELKRKTALARERASAEIDSRQLDRQSLESSRAAVEALRKQLKEFEDHDRLIYKNSETSKTAWLVELSGQRILAMRAGEQAVEKRFHDLAGLREWIRDRDSSAEYVVLIIKPSGIDHFERLEQDFDGFGVDIGFDIIDESQTVLPTESL